MIRVQFRSEWVLRILLSGAALVVLLFVPNVEAENVGDCRVKDVPIAESITDMDPFTPGFPGLTHISVAGVQQHGMKEVEVWLETLAPGSATPIHSHISEEVFVVLKGKGTVYLSKLQTGTYPGEPEAFAIAVNSTVRVPPNRVHQMANTDTEDLQFLISISQPPMKALIYPDWSTPHDEASVIFPFASDPVSKECSGSGPTLESQYGFIQE